MQQPTAWALRYFRPAFPPGRRRGGGMALLMAMLVGWAGVLSGCRCDRKTPRDEGPPPADGGADSLPPAAMSASRIWTVAAKEAGVSLENIARVKHLLLEARPSAQHPLTRVQTGRLQTALRGFLKAERDCFAEATAVAHLEHERHAWLVRGKCYWTAWLLAEAVGCPEIAPARSREIRKSVRALAEGAATLVDAADADGVRRALLAECERLQGDALFPALREPVTPAERKRVLARSGGVKPLSVRALLARVMFELTFDRIRPRQTEYWGHMMVVDYGPDEPGWPVSLAFVPDEEMNRLTKWRREQPSAVSTRPGRW